MRSPRAFTGPLSISAVAAAFVSLGCRAAGVEGVRGVLGSSLLPLLAVAVDGEVCGAVCVAVFAFVGVLPDALAAAFAALCRSCSSLLSALVISF